MNTFTIVASILALVLAVAASPINQEVSTPDQLPRIDEYTQGQACPAGKLFNDRCNLCHCAANGRSAACTLMLCLSEEVEEMEDTQRRVLSPATEIYSWPHIDGYSVGDSCPAGQMFFNDCNICRCSEDGKLASCTIIFCAPETVQRDRRSLSDEYNWPHIDNYHHGDACPANQMFYNVCNTCRCLSDGRSAACTLMLCISEEQ